MIASWFNVPRVVRVLLLCPIVVGIEVALIVALFPPLPRDPIHFWSFLAALVLVAFVGADLPNASHVSDAPSPNPSVAHVLGFFIWLVLLASESCGVAWLSYNWSHPQADQVFFIQPWGRLF
jgi:hypothetical protein